MIKRSYLLLCIICIGSASASVFGRGKDLNATELLRHYEESLSQLQSLSMKIDTEVDVDKNHPKKWVCPYKTHFIFRCDHGTNRSEWVGRRVIFDEQGNIDLLNSRVIKHIITGELYANVLSTPLNASPRGVLMTRDYKAHQKDLLDSAEYGGPLFGKIFGSNHKSVPELLWGATDLHVQDEQENINGVFCHVLEGTTKHGKVTAWIAPQKGYTALRWSIEKHPQHHFDKNSLSTKWPEIERWRVVFDSVDVQEVNDVFATTAGNLTLTIDFAKGRRTSYYKYKASEVELNPDFDALGAFKIDLPDGTRVYMEEFPGIKYIWHDGKIVADIDDSYIDMLDDAVRGMKSKADIEATVTKKKNKVSIEKSTSMPKTAERTEETKQES